MSILKYSAKTEDTAKSLKIFRSNLSLDCHRQSTVMSHLRDDQQKILRDLSSFWERKIYWLSFKVVFILRDSKKYEYLHWMFRSKLIGLRTRIGFCAIEKFCLSAIPPRVRFHLKSHGRCKLKYIRYEKFSLW